MHSDSWYTAWHCVNQGITYESFKSVYAMPQSQPVAQNAPALRLKLWSVQVLLVLLYTVSSYWMLCKTVREENSRLLSFQEEIYLWGFLPLEAYCSSVHAVLFGSKLPFLPLLLTSVYSALGVTYIWLCMARKWMPHQSVQQGVHQKRMWKH